MEKVDTGKYKMKDSQFQENVRSAVLKHYPNFKTKDNKFSWGTGTVGVNAANTETLMTGIAIIDLCEHRGCKISFDTEFDIIAGILSYRLYIMDDNRRPCDSDVSKYFYAWCKTCIDGWKRSRHNI
jgi:hypothetical protein